eukprot:789842-Prorocentrum_minimum.AAC.2
MSGAGDGACDGAHRRGDGCWRGELGAGSAREGGGCGVHPSKEGVLFSVLAAGCGDWKRSGGVRLGACLRVDGPCAVLPARPIETGSRNHGWRRIRRRIRRRITDGHVECEKPNGLNGWRYRGGLITGYGVEGSYLLRRSRVEQSHVAARACTALHKFYPGRLRYIK